MNQRIDMTEVFKGKNILITGGAGSVGKALTARILDFDPGRIRVFDISENEIFKMMKIFEGEKRLRFLVGDIRDRSRLKFAVEGIDIIIHLAAMKHVYACEYNSFEAIRTNIDGIQNVIDIARKENVKIMVFSSTDKAAYPVSVMGITKLLGEKLVSSANYYRGLYSKTKFTSVRFGNVAGSNGSIIPLFKKQIMSGGPVTVTDETMSRFVITMREATELIFSAIKTAKGGETFVWKMKALKIMDLLEAMIQKYAPGKKLEIAFTGKGEGEKLYEDALTEEELPKTKESDNYYIIMPSIDYMHINTLYTDVPDVRNPVMASHKGAYMNLEEITELLEELDENNTECVVA